MKNNILKTLGVGALALSGIFAFSGCSVNGNEIKSLQDKISVLEQQIQDLQTPVTPEIPEETEFTINSDKEAYDYLVESTKRSFVKEDGTLRNYTQIQKVKYAGDTQWTVNDSSFMYMGTLQNGVQYVLSGYGYDTIFETLQYKDGENYYEFQMTTNKPTEDRDFEGSVYYSKKQLNNVDNLWENMIGSTNYEIKSYQQLENGNFEIVFEQLSVSVYGENTSFSFTKNVNTAIINKEGLILSAHIVSYNSNLNHTTNIQTDYVKVGERMVESVYFEETPEHILQMLAVAERTELM